MGSCRSMCRSGNAQATGPGCAKDCTQEQIFEEVWGQLVDHIDDRSSPRSMSSQVPRSSNRVPNPSEATNLEPLLVNTEGRGMTALCRDEDPQLLPRRRLRAHIHRSRHDGGSERGGAPSGERNTGARVRSERCRVGALREPARVALRALDRVRGAWSAGSAASRRPKPPGRREATVSGLLLRTSHPHD